MIPNVINRLERYASRSGSIVSIMRVLRNHSQRVMRFHLAPSNEPALNGEADLLKRIGPHCHTFIDCGANVGDWTKLMLKHVPRESQGCLLEPVPSTFRILQETFKSSNYNLILKQIAAGEKDSDLQLYAESGGGTRSSVDKYFTAANATPINVTMQTISSIMEELNWTHLDFLKIDAEGYDALVL